MHNSIMTNTILLLVTLSLIIFACHLSVYIAIVVSLLITTSLTIFPHHVPMKLNYPSLVRSPPSRAILSFTLNYIKI